MAKKGKTAAKPKPEVPFEQSLTNLKEIVSELEHGDLTLDESLARYESGMRQLRLCYSSLKSAEQKINQLVSVDNRGIARTTNFDGEATFVPPDADDEMQAELQAELDEETSHVETEKSENDDSESDDMDEGSSLF